MEYEFERKPIDGRKVSASTENDDSSSATGSEKEDEKVIHSAVIVLTIYSD